MSLNCDNTRDMVSLYMDGAVSERTGEDIAIHLKSCRECKRFYRDYKESMGRSRIVAGETGFSKNFSDIARRMRKKENLRLTAFLTSFVSAVAATVILTKLLFQKGKT